MPRIKTPCAYDSRHAALPNVARQSGSSQFCPLHGAFHFRQNKPGGNRFSSPAPPDAIALSVVGATRSASYGASLIDAPSNTAVAAGATSASELWRRGVSVFAKARAACACHRSLTIGERRCMMAFLRSVRRSHEMQRPNWRAWS